MTDRGTVYVAAGDEMKKLLEKRFPGCECVPFREDFSRGEREGGFFTARFIEERAAFWGIPAERYREDLAPVTGLDLSRDLVLIFGEDACCRANLAFLLEYLKSRGYSRPVTVRIVDEYDLTVKREYDQIPGGNGG